MKSFEHHIISRSLHLVQNQLRQLKRKYGHLPNFAQIFKTLEQKTSTADDFESVGNIFFNFNKPASSPMPIFKQELLSNVSKSNFDLEPDFLLEDILITFLSDAREAVKQADYFFLKACLLVTQDDDIQGAIWELEKGLFIYPESWQLIMLFQLLTYIDTYSLEAWITNLSKYPVLQVTAPAKAKNYFLEAAALQQFIYAPATQKTHRFNQWLTFLPDDEIELLPILKHFDKSIAPDRLLELYEIAKHKNPRELALDILPVIALYNSGDYKGCIAAYLNLPSEGMLVSPYYELEVRVLYAHALVKLGDKGVAMLELTDITGPDTVYDEMQDEFFEGCFLLAKLFHECNRTTDAEQVYSRCLETHNEYLEEAYGYDLYHLKGDIAMHKDQLQEAVGWYNKAEKWQKGGK